MVVALLLLFRLSKKEGMSLTKHARYAVEAGVFVILCCGWWVTCTADRYHTRIRVGIGHM